MKMAYYVIMIAALVVTISSVEARFGKKDYALCKKQSTINWPNKAYQETKNSISLSVRALSCEETEKLFLGAGKYLADMKGFCYLTSQPIVPLYITVKNDDVFPVSLSEKNLDLGSFFFFFSRHPVNVANVVESLENFWFWSSSIENETSFVTNSAGKIVATVTKNKINKNPLIKRFFVSHDDFSLVDFFNLEPSILDGDDFTHSSIVIQAGKTKEVLVFLWAKEIGPDFNITIAKNKFNVNLFA